jgi:hypothetical protein
VRENRSTVIRKFCGPFRSLAKSGRRVLPPSAFGRGGRCATRRPRISKGELPAAAWAHARPSYGVILRPSHYDRSLKASPGVGGVSRSRRCPRAHTTMDNFAIVCLCPSDCSGGLEVTLRDGAAVCRRGRCRRRWERSYECRTEWANRLTPVKRLLRRSTSDWVSGRRELEAITPSPSCSLSPSVA